MATVVGSNATVIRGISNFTIGNSIAYTIDRYASAKDTLTVKIGSTTVKTVALTETATGTFNKTVSFSSSELTAIYNAMATVTKAVFTFTVKSTNGSTSTSATGTLGANIKPTISSTTLNEAVSGIKAQFASYVQNRSKISYAVTATAGSGTSIDSIQFSLDGKIYSGSTGTTGVLSFAGTREWKVTVTDKRGRAAVSSGTISAVAYDKPSIRNFNVFRTNSSGTADITGAYMRYQVTASISSVNSKNTKSFLIEYKKESDTNWTTWKTDTSSYSLNESSTAKAADANSIYLVRITLTDFFGEETKATKNVVVNASAVMFEYDADKLGFAFGKPQTEDNCLDVGLSKTYLSQDVWMGGNARSDAEKNLRFNSTGDGAYTHDCKVYGGNGSSETSIGMWDTALNKLIYRYVSSTRAFHFGSDVKILQNNLPILVEALKSYGANKGKWKTNDGLLLQWGKVSITPTANTPTKLTVSFEESYSALPVLTCVPQTSAPQNMSVSVGQQSGVFGSFDIYLTRTTATATSIQWIAIGMKG